MLFCSSGSVFFWPPLLNLPGEAASVVTCIDGYNMAQQGRAGAALGIAAIGSFIAGTVAVVGLTLFAPPIAEFALGFGPPEKFALALLGLLMAVTLSGDSVVKGLIIMVLGLLFGTVGIGEIFYDLAQPVMYQNSVDFAKFLKQAYADYGKLIKDLNISIQ